MLCDRLLFVKEQFGANLESMVKRTSQDIEAATLLVWHTATDKVYRRSLVGLITIDSAVFGGLAVLKISQGEYGLALMDALASAGFAGTSYGINKALKALHRLSETSIQAHEAKRKEDKASS